MSYALDEAQSAELEEWLASVKVFFRGDESALDAGLDLRDVLFGVSIEYFVKLVPNLGHFSEMVRKKITTASPLLAKLFEPRFVQVVTASAVFTFCLQLLISKGHRRWTKKWLWFILGDFGLYLGNFVLSLIPTFVK